MSGFRLWLINFLVGDMSYVKNITFVQGQLLVRPKNTYFAYCQFINGTKVEASEYKFEQTKGQMNE